MPTPKTVEAFVATVESGDYVGAIERFYAPDASMQENTDPPRVGREVLAEGERQVMARSGQITARKVGPALITGDQVAIRWMFEFAQRDGQARRLDEIAWQTWRGEKIVEETFFYDPKQMGR